MANNWGPEVQQGRQYGKSQKNSKFLRILTEPFDCDGTCRVQRVCYENGKKWTQKNRRSNRNDDFKVRVELLEGS